MFELSVLFVGVVAVLASGGVLAARMDRPTRVILTAFALVAWSIFAWASFSVDVATNGEIVSQAHMPLVFLGVGGAVVMLAVLFMAAFDTIQDSPAETMREMGRS